jgi:hypothetical protein
MIFFMFLSGRFSRFRSSTLCQNLEVILNHSRKTHMYVMCFFPIMLLLKLNWRLLPHNPNHFSHCWIPHSHSHRQRQQLLLFLLLLLLIYPPSLHHQIKFGRRKRVYYRYMQIWLLAIPIRASSFLLFPQLISPTNFGMLPIFFRYSMPFFPHFHTLPFPFWFARCQFPRLSIQRRSPFFLMINTIL